ncbi:DNA methyltransferase, partial [Acidobacteriota bacterium]
MNILLRKLGLAENKGLYWTAEKKWKKLGLPFRIQKNLELINPTAFFCINNEFYILFFENPAQREEKKVHREIWNFSQAPLAFIIDDTKISVFNAFHLDNLDKKGKRGLQMLDELDINDSPGKTDTYSIWNLISGKFWEDNKNAFKSDGRVDWYLLKNIEEAILLLKEKNLARKIANKIIGFLIFTRYLIDRKVKIDEKYINNKSVEQVRKSLLTVIQVPAQLIGFYNHLKNAFNGDLFELSAVELKGIDFKHCEILHILFQGGGVLKKQPSLFDIYDFEIIPIELVSNVYERFIGKVKQKKSKAFYTPPFLVDYILEKTVAKHLKKAGSSRCRVLDPACGSGIFLVETFRQIVEKEKKLKGDKFSTKELEGLLIDNIYGIDDDAGAIDIAIFSLYITLLDYKEPREIVNYKFPYLKYKENKSDSERG